MQAAGMLRGTGAIRSFPIFFICALIFLAHVSENAYAHPLQVLPNIPGYIPVYIRHGDQPLNEINPELAEAFHEKQTLESMPEKYDHSSDDLVKNSEIHHSYDNEEDIGGLNAGTRRKETIYLIGVRQSGDDKNKKGGDLGEKIALPFEILERAGNEASTGPNGDDDPDESSKDVWTKEVEKESSDPPRRKPIGLSREAAIKESGYPVDVRELERLAAEVEKEETRPNDLYDSAIMSGRRVVYPSRDSDMSDDDDTNNEELEKIMDDVQDPTEFRSSRSRTNEERLRPERDPKESRPDHDSTDFMVQEE